MQDEYEGTKARVALYGGSFNPPHTSHVLSVAYALSACPIDAVWVVPVWRHAFDKPLAPFSDRVEMCRRAFAPFGHRARVAEVERELGGVSRTIDTVRYLLERHEHISFSLLLGADLFAERHRWKQFEELERLVSMHVVGRAGVEPPSDVATGPPLPAVSSTDIRDRLAKGESVVGLVPLAVAAYAEQRALYSSSPRSKR